MCGIAGFVNTNTLVDSNALHKKATLNQMLASLNHRGPDSSGLWHDETKRVFFGHTRLAILDLSSAGHQPMSSASGRFVLTFNGEIYNHLSLRKLISKEFKSTWRGTSDTETLLSCIDLWGLEKTITLLKGMFAFACWDKQKKELYLVRDRIGEKPLYYAANNLMNIKEFVFSSELSAFKKHDSLDLSICTKAVSAFTQLGYVPAPLSIYKNVKKLLPGTFLKLSCETNQYSIKTYWDPSVKFESDRYPYSENEALEMLEKKLTKSVQSQLISDVPIGAFLSGGVDSSLIVSLMQKISQRPVETFSIGFQVDGYDESKFAKKISEHLGTSHNELIVTPQMAMKVIPEIQSAYSEPFADSSQIPTLLVSQLARQKVTVSLSGDGGDELFCGYNRYFYTLKFWKFMSTLPLSVRKRISTLMKLLPPNKINNLINLISLRNNKINSKKIGDKLHKAASIFSSNSALDAYYKLISMAPDSNKSLQEQFIISEEYGRVLNYINNDNAVELMMFLDLVTYLPDDILVKVDRAAMFYSLETRVPFLDHEVIEFALQLPINLKYKNGKSKWILRELLSKYIPRNLFERPKMGFGVPIGDWIKGPIRPWALDLLSKDNINHAGIFDDEHVTRLLTSHLNGEKDNQYELWPILMMQSWLLFNR